MLTNDNSRWKYTHKDHTDVVMLKGQLMSRCASHPKQADLIAVLSGTTLTGEPPTVAARMTDANATLFAMLCGELSECQTQMIYVMTNYSLDGKAAYDWLESSFTAGNDNNKLEAADTEYKNIERIGMPADADPKDVLNKLSRLTTLRTTMSNTDYAINTKRHSIDLIRFVRSMSNTHQDECDKVAFGDLESHPMVVGALDGVVRKVHARMAVMPESKDKLHAFLSSCGSSESEIMALVARSKNNNGKKTPCTTCDKVHGPVCYVKELMKGTPPADIPGFARMPAAVKNSCVAMAKEKKPGLVVPTVLMCQPIAERDEPAAVVLAAQPQTFEIRVDGQAGNRTPYHFIRDKALFVSMTELPQPLPIGGVGGSIAATMIGAIAFATAEGDHYVLGDCVYVPSCPANLLNHTALEKKGHVVDTKHRRIEVANGSIIRLSCEDISFDVTLPVGTPAVRAMTAVPYECVQRGARGTLHMDTNPMVGKTRAMFDMNMARCNDPSLGRLQHMHDIADGVPEILRNANAVNTATQARLLADPPQSAPRAGSTPTASRPGELTQSDLWQGPCVSIVGNKYLDTFYDSHSTNFVVYPLARKDQAPAATDRYFLDCKSIGVDMDKGGVLYTDNEIVLNSVKMNAVATKHQQARKNSNEYEPTGNSGAESTFRILPHEMRKSMIRAGAPDEFWDFAAIDAQELMAATRMRDGISVGEKFDGRRRNLSRRRVWGCRVVAKKPAPWVQNKTDDRGVVGINLGRSRTKPGWNVWCPEYGVFTTKHVTFHEHSFPFNDGTFVLPTQRRSTGGTGGGGIGGDIAIAPAMAPPTDDDSDDDDNGDDADDSDGDDGGGDDGGGDDGDDDDDGDDEDDEVAQANVQRDAQYADAALHRPPTRATSRASSGPGTNDRYDQDEGLMDDEASSGVSASMSSISESLGSVDEFGNFTNTYSETSASLVHVFRAAVMKERVVHFPDQDAGERVPPPWRGLKGSSADMQELFMAAEMKEINGILDTGSAYEVLHKDIGGEKVYTTLTLRDIKKNGPKKGQAKVRVCVNRGPETETSHSPTIQIATLRAMLALFAAVKNVGTKNVGTKCRTGDFPQAYLNANQRVYHVWPPKSARQYDENGNRIVWALPKALYGGRASGRHWYMRLRKWMLEHDFTVSEWDPCLFIKKKEDKFHYVGVYVDDLVHVYNDSESYEETVRGFQTDFHGYTDLGDVTEIFNAEVAVTDTHVTLTQTRFIETLTALHLSNTFEKAHTPADVALTEVIARAQAEGAVPLGAEEHATYRAIVGAILYLATVCRPDVAVAVGLLSRVLEKPTAEALEAAKRTLRYLHTYRAIGLRWTVGAGTTLLGQSDSDWSVARSTSGYVFFMCQAAIAYICKKQVSIAMSSTEAEIMAASLAALEAVFLRGLLAELGCEQPGPTVLGVDNQGAVALAKNYISNSRTKHIERRHLKIRELVEQMQVRAEFVPTEENVADILTKPLARPRFEKLRRLLMNHVE